MIIGKGGLSICYLGSRKEGGNRDGSIDFYSEFYGGRILGVEWLLVES